MKDQPDSRPTRKVTAYVLASSVVTLLVFAASEAGFELTPEVTGALTTLIGFVLAYFVRERG